MKKLWYEESVFYHIYPLGFCGAPVKNNYEPQADRLLKVCDWIPHLKGMGINAIYLGPLFQSETHGYDTVDYYKVDSRLGSSDALKALIHQLHDNGIKVVLDGVFNHVSRDFFAFKDLIHNKENSKYKEWFMGVDFSKSSPYNDQFNYECWAGHYNLVTLNLKNPEVVDYLFKAITMWVEDFNIDGLRLDVADVLDFDFMGQLSTFAKSIKDDFWLMGEVIHGDYNNWVNPGMLHSTTNYECYKGLHSSMNDKNLFEVAHSLKRLFNKESGLYKNMSLYNFVDNHDVERVSSVLENPAHLYPLHILLFSIPGVPSIYYGSEWGIQGKKQNHNDDNLRPELNLSQMCLEENSDLLMSIKRLSSLWHKSEALKHGSYQEVLVQSEQLIFIREYQGEKVVVIVNTSSEATSMHCDLPQDFQNGIDLLNSNEKVDVASGQLNIEIPANWGRIIRF